MLNEESKQEIYSNYKRKNKWFGILDYKSLIFICIYFFIIIFILRNISIKLEYLIYIFVILFIPVISLVLINNDNDSAIDTLIIIFHYLFNSNFFVKKEYIKNTPKTLYVRMKKDKK